MMGVIMIGSGTGGNPMHTGSARSLAEYTKGGALVSPAVPPSGLSLKRR